MSLERIHAASNTVERRVHRSAVTVDPSPWRAAVLWYLIVMLPLCGLFAVQRQLLGPLHVHRPALQALKAASLPPLVALAHALDIGHSHAHGGGHGPAVEAAARHHHAIGDATVVGQDGVDAAAEVDGSTAASPLMAGHVPSMLRNLRRDLSAHWHSGPRVRVARLSLAPPLRPPRA
jgi:hypothetical protein